jgi:hypothetical protein
MAIVVFGNGHELTVTADSDEILKHVTEAQRGGAEQLPAGWICLTTPDQQPVCIQSAQIAFIRP